MIGFPLYLWKGVFLTTSSFPMTMSWKEYTGQSWLQLSQRYREIITVLYCTVPGEAVFFNYFFIPDDNVVERVHRAELAAAEPEIP